LQLLIYRASSLATTLLVIVLAGCAHHPAASTPPPVNTVPAQPAPAPPPPSPASSPPPVSPTAGADAARADRNTTPPEPPAKEPAKTAPVPPAASARPAAKPATTNPAASAAPRSSSTALPTGTASPGPSLDLASLEQRLRDTHAIGVFTKLSLKNQVDDLLAQLRAYHHGQAEPTLAQLRQRYELLLLKVVTLLQDGDAPLATAVSSSREAIWGILTDPRKFAQI